MRRDLVSRFQNALPIIQSDLVFEDVAAPLIANNILAPAEYQAVLSGSSDSGRATILVDILMGKDDQMFNAFLEVLRVDHPWLAEAITGEDDPGDVTDSVPINRHMAACCQNQVNEEMELSRSRCCDANRAGKRPRSPSRQPCSKRISASSSSPQSGESSASQGNGPTLVLQPVNRADEELSRRPTAQYCNSTTTAQVPPPTVQYSTPLVPESPQTVAESRDTRRTVASSGDSDKLSQGLTDEMMSLLKKNHRATRDWTSLAHALGLSRLVNKIRVKVVLFGEDLDLCVVHLLQEWKGEQPKTATLLNLLHVLRAEGFNDVADELVEKFAC